MAAAGWVEGDTRTILVQGVIPLVLGIGLCFLACLYLFGIFPFRRRHDDQVAPMMLSAGSSSDSTTDAMTPEDAEKTFGPVACQAQLFGMKQKERHAVLEKMFSDCKKHKDSKGEDDNTDNSEQPPEDSVINVDIDTRCACAICLREYEDEDEVLTGSSCEHKFHKSCAMLWLTHYKKPKDHCPYCRKVMLSPIEMKAAAIEVLGEERIQELAQFPPPRQENTTTTLSQSQDSLDNDINVNPDIEEGTA